MRLILDSLEKVSYILLTHPTRLAITLCIADLELQSMAVDVIPAKIKSIYNHITKTFLQEVYFGLEVIGFLTQA